MNPAQRILNVAIAVARHEQPNNRCLPAWVTICSSLSSKGKKADEHRISAIFSALNDEVGLLTEEMEERSLPKDIYIPYLNQFRLVLQPTLLAGAWSNCADKINQNTINILQWISLYLGEQEGLIQKEDLDELISSLRGLDALIAEPGLPRNLRKMIKNNVDAIWEALDLYQVYGAAGLGDTIKRAAGELILNSSEIQSALTSENETTRTTCTSFLETIKRTVSVFNTTVKTSENLVKIAHFMDKLPASID